MVTGGLGYINANDRTGIFITKFKWELVLHGDYSSVLVSIAGYANLKLMEPYGHGG